MVVFKEIILVLLGSGITLIGLVIKHKYEKNKNIFNHYNVFDEKRNKAFEDISKHLNIMSFSHPSASEFDEAYQNLLDTGKYQHLLGSEFNLIWDELINYMSNEREPEQFVNIKNKLFKYMYDKTGIYYIDNYIDKYTKIKKVKSK